MVVCSSDPVEGPLRGRRQGYVSSSHVSSCIEKRFAVFWRSDKLRQLVPLAVQQVPVAISVNILDGKSAVSELLTSVLSMLDDDVMAKSLNLDVLMHCRSEDARVRLFSLTCAEQLWRAHGDKLLGMFA